VVAGPVVAVVTLLLALVATRAAGVTFRDWEHAVASRLAHMACAVALLVVLDITVRAAARSRKLGPSWAAMRDVRRERWPRRRLAAVGGALVSFYVTYLAYRNVKSAVPLLRPGDLFDGQLASFDRTLFGGNDPAALLHSLMGTGIAAEILSLVYMAFFYLLLISLPLALVFSPLPQRGIFYVTAVSINWALGAASYLLLPARGPIYATPGGFADLPATDVTHLQGVLLRQRLEFLRDPMAADAHQGIAAFGSLHTSIIFTAAVAAHLSGLGRRVRIGLWVLFALTTTSTVYLGWHYVVDDLAGVVIALAALGLARALTGFEPRTAWRRLRWRPGIAGRRAGAPTVQHIPATRPLEASVAETTSGSDAT
jgi:membrane-associated phospholipid phosphatase